MLSTQDIASLGFNRPKNKGRRERVSKSGQITLSKKNWRALVQDVWFDAGGRCENTITVPGLVAHRCPNKANDPHHLIFRSQGGSDTKENVFAACRFCHDAKHDEKQDFIPWNEGEYDA